MKAIITSLLLFGIGESGFGQGSVTLHTANSNAKYYVSNNGAFFHNTLPNGTGGYFVPKDSLVSAIYGMAFMAVGRDVNGQLKGAIAQYQASDFTPGPYLSNPINYDSPTYIYSYGTSLWDVTKVQIDNHIAHWMDSGYVVPGIIASWPGNGNSGNGESALLAPFHDQDGNQIYEPQNGDYPLIRGDKAVYSIINDGKSVHPSGVDPVGMEVHLLFYQYEDSTDSALTNTVFFQTTIYNRGTQTLTDFHAGHLLDFDLGNPNDDYNGTEPNRHLAYVYNSDLNDESFSGNSGYGLLPPAAGIINLDGSLNSNIPLSNSTVSSASEYNNILSGLLPDGSPLLDGDSLPTTYLYNDIDPVTGWNEFMGTANVPGDRRSATAHNAEVFSPGKVLCYNNAAIFARKYHANLTASVDSLFQVADHIQDFYDLQNFYCEAQFLDLSEEHKLSISVYPNPAKDYIQVEGLTSGMYRVINLEGKEILSGNLETSIIQIDSLKNGFYLLEITSGGKRDRKSFVKE